MTQYQLSQTEDGSPTLLTTYSSGVAEKMHHFRGAMTESLYIYEPAAIWSLENAPNTHVMSLGLGLGYNELISVATALRLKKPVEITTFEIDEELSQAFLNWLRGETTPWFEAYDQIEKWLETRDGLPKGSLRQELAHAHATGRWRLLGAFPQVLPVGDQYSAIFYDAFSGKMDSPLWDQTFLNEFLARHAAPDSVLATYASTGNLKRALRQNQFTLHEKKGFAGKAESTFATRIASTPQEPRLTPP